MPADNNPNGSAALNQAIAAMSQINLLIPIALTAGTALVKVIRGFQGTSPDADAAIAEFNKKAEEISKTAETWLQDHPQV